MALAEDNLKRDKRLFQDKVGTERAVLEAQQAFKEVRINVTEAETTLHAVGQTEDQIEQIDSLAHGKLSEYQLVSPLKGIVTKRQLTIGEVVEPTGNGAPLVVADLSSVWVNLTVYQRDLAHVKAGQRVKMTFGHGIRRTGLHGDGKIYVIPVDNAVRIASGERDEEAV